MSLAQRKLYQSVKGTGIDVLAKPKSISAGFIEDRRSVYWVDKLPPQPPTVFVLTPRLNQLIKPKQPHPSYQPDWPSPVSIVSKGAQNYPERERLKRLSLPKLFHRDWKPDNSVITSVTQSAKNAKASKRLCQLAHCRSYDPLLIKSNSSWEWGVWKSDVPKESLAHVASARLEQLAESKKPHKNYEGNRHIQWPVCEAAKNAQASTRHQQLARPKARAALDQDYDPYRVSYAARNAVASPRVSDLCMALPRKTRTKKV